MGIQSPKLVWPLSPYDVHLVTYILRRVLIIGHLIANVSLVCVVMRMGYLLASEISNWWPSHRCIGQVIRWELQGCGEIWRGLACSMFRNPEPWHFTPVIFWKAILVRIWSDALQRQSLWSAHSYRFLGSPAIAPERQFLEKVGC